MQEQPALIRVGLRQIRIAVLRDEAIRLKAIARHPRTSAAVGWTLIVLNDAEWFSTAHYDDLAETYITYAVRNLGVITDKIEAQGPTAKLTPSEWLYVLK